MTKPKTESDNLPKPLGHPRNGLRMFRDDDEAIIELVSEIKAHDFKMTVPEMIRDCVEAGLPAMQEKWAPLIDGPTE